MRGRLYLRIVLATQPVYQYLPKPWNNEDLRLSVTRALQHYEANRARHELEMKNQRLISRLNEIQQLSSLDIEEMVVMQK